MRFYLKRGSCGVEVAWPAGKNHSSHLNQAPTVLMYSI